MSENKIMKHVKKAYKYGSRGAGLVAGYNHIKDKKKESEIRDMKVLRNGQSEDDKRMHRIADRLEEKKKIKKVVK